MLLALNCGIMGARYVKSVGIYVMNDSIMLWKRGNILRPTPCRLLVLVVP